MFWWWEHDGYIICHVSCSSACCWCTVLVYYLINIYWFCRKVFAIRAKYFFDFVVLYIISMHIGNIYNIDVVEKTNQFRQNILLTLL